MRFFSGYFISTDKRELLFYLFMNHERLLLQQERWQQSFYLYVAHKMITEEVEEESQMKSLKGDVNISEKKRRMQRQQTTRKISLKAYLEPPFLPFLKAFLNLLCFELCDESERFFALLSTCFFRKPLMVQSSYSMNIFHKDSKQILPSTQILPFKLTQFTFEQPSLYIKRVAAF